MKKIDKMIKTAQETRLSGSEDDPLCQAGRGHRCDTDTA